MKKKFIITTVAVTTAVIAAATAKQIGYWLGWYPDAQRPAIVGGLALTNLLLVSFLSLGVALRLMLSEENAARDWIVWVVIGIGFLVLFADSTLDVYDWIETRFEHLAGYSSTDWTHRIDDLLVAIGGLIGIAAIVHWRHALARSRESFWLYWVAIALLCVMMLVDLSTDHLAFLGPEMAQMRHMKLTRGGIELVEDSLMLIGEALLVVGTFFAFQAAGHVGRNRITRQRVPGAPRL